MMFQCDMVSGWRIAQVRQSVKRKQCEKRIKMKRLAIFAGYDRDSIIDDYVIYYLKELKKVADIIFVCDTEFSNNELSKIDELTIFQICKKHNGYDFGSYKRGYLWAKEQGILESYDSLIFCNDSVYGPFRPFQEIFDEMEAKENTDFWGIFYHEQDGTAPGKEDKRYMQSYFCVYKKHVFTSNAFNSFILEIQQLNPKRDYIIRYEIGLTQTLLGSGFTPNALFSSEKNKPCSQDFAALIDAGFPFLKRCLFDYRSNLLFWINLKDYNEIISEKYNSYPVEHINNNLSRLFKSDGTFYHRYANLPVFDVSIVSPRLFNLKANYNKDLGYKLALSIFGKAILKIRKAAEKGGTKIKPALLEITKSP